MLPKIIKIGYEALNLINFFTFGPKEVRDFSVICADTPGPHRQYICYREFRHLLLVNVALTGSRVDHSEEFKGARGRGRHSF
jgi:hypothetical protein